MADKTVIIKLDVQEAGAIASIEGLNDSLKKLDKTSDEYAVILKKIQAEETKLASIQKQRAGAQKSVTKALNKQSDATGSATAATMELSRVVSDAPYGIRGMANNITQLVSQLGTASTKAGGFRAALTLMGKQLIGPLGIVFAITAVVSALDFMYGANKKAEGSTNDYADSLKGLEKTLSSLYLTQDDVNKKFDEYADLAKLRVETDNLMKKEAIKLAELNKQIADQEEFNAIAKARRFKGEAKRDKILNDLLDKRNAIYTVTTNAISKLKKETKEFNAAEEDSLKGLKSSKKEKEEQRELLSKTSQEYKKLTKTIDEYQKKIEEIEGVKGKPKKRPKVDVLGLDSIDIGENKKKMKKVLDAVADAVGIDLKKNPLEIDTNLDLSLSDEAKKIIADKLKSDLDNLMLDSKLEDAKEFIDKSKAVLGAMTDFVNSEFERELTIEQNKTNALNTELNNRLNNENLSKDQRASIQNQIAQNDEKLRVKQDAIEKKKFKMNKAARIANALMDTASAAIGVMADSKGGFLARLTNAIPTIAFGLAQVAAISRQKFQSSASKTPISTTAGGGSGGSSRAEPSFNIVGRSQDNILLDAIQSQFDKPLKAYVVARDITNQQQLDGVISTSAST
tara:strand:+ start:35 stop:1909 length:1875 start_codon:yes stop_codon:yes gene_type:complete